MGWSRSCDTVSTAFYLPSTTNYQPLPPSTDPVPSYINHYHSILTQYHQVSTSTNIYCWCLGITDFCTVYPGSCFYCNVILWNSKHILSHCEGSQKCIFMPFSWLQMIILRGRPLANDHQEEELGILVVGWKWLVSWVKYVAEHIKS